VGEQYREDKNYSCGGTKKEKIHLGGAEWTKGVRESGEGHDKGENRGRKGRRKERKWRLTAVDGRRNEGMQTIDVEKKGKKAWGRERLGFEEVIRRDGGGGKRDT